MKKVTNNISRWRWQLAILAVGLILWSTNYSVGKYLTGWDNLQTELDLWLNIKRAFWAVWEEYQSFGLLAGMAHGAEITRNILLVPFVLLLPDHMVRYTFFIATLTAGGLGMFRLFRHTVFHDRHPAYSFFGSMFYMLNLGTVQIFFLPFEPFSMFFAALPWLVDPALRIFRNENTKRDWVYFAIASIIGGSFAALQQLFAVYMLALGVIALVYFIKQRTLRTAFKMVAVFVLILCLNAYWIIPQVYFLRTSGNVITEAKINQLSTQEVFNENRSKGTLDNFIRLEGFYYELTDSARNNLFQAWHNHFDNQIFLFFQIIFMSTLIAGLFYWRNKYYPMYMALLFLVCVALLNNTQPFAFLSGLIRNVAIVNQIFRSPFTKFIVLYVFTGSYFFTAGLIMLRYWYRRFRIRDLAAYDKYIPVTGFVLVSITIFLYALPAFQGNFFSPKMKVAIPDKYFQMMDFFKQQDKNKRIALLPDYTFWGWFNHTWGYYGSGFLWYGIEQPIVSRTFDVWSKESEGYFWEVKQALQSESPEELERVMDKYDVDYIVFDESVLPLNAAKTSKQFALLEKILSQSAVLSKVQAWDKLAVYERRNPAARNVSNFITRRNSVPNIGPDFFVTNTDRAYNEHGTYKTDTSKPFDFFYPFIDFMTQTRFPKKTWEIDESPGTYQLSRQIPFDVGGYELSIATDEAPLASSGAEITPAVGNSRLRVTPTPVNQFDSRIRNLQAGFSAAMNDDWLVLNIPKINLVNFDVRNTTINDCDFGKKDIQANTTESSLSVKVFNSSTACFSYAAEFLPQSYGYILTIENKNWLGQPLFFYILDGTKESSFIEDRLRNPTDYFIMKSNPNIPPEFAVNFQANSYGPLSSTNDLYTVRMDVFPVDIINSIYYQRKNIQVPLGENLPILARKNSYYSYTADVTANTNQQSNLIFYQAYHPGWKAYGPDGKELEHHYRINNWANGWDIPAGTTGEISLLFWPQYLEYIGFGIGFLSLLVLSGWVWVRRRSHTPLPHHMK